MNVRLGGRLTFNLTLLMGGIFGIAAGGAPTFVGLASLMAVSSVGVGGNLPIDSAVFLGRHQSRCATMLSNTTAEFIPGSHQYLLTVLSVWWAIGQLLASLVFTLFSCVSSEKADRYPQIAWPLIAYFSCAPSSSTPCTRADNMGWRYVLFTIGGLVLLLSFL